MLAKGILDSENLTDLHLHLSALREKWDGLDQSVHPQKYPQVYEWILKMKQPP